MLNKSFALFLTLVHSSGPGHLTGTSINRTSESWILLPQCYTFQNYRLPFPAATWPVCSWQTFPPVRLDWPQSHVGQQQNPDNWYASAQISYHHSYCAVISEILFIKFILFQSVTAHNENTRPHIVVGTDRLSCLRQQVSTRNIILSCILFIK